MGQHRTALILAVAGAALFAGCSGDDDYDDVILATASATVARSVTVAPIPATPAPPVVTATSTTASATPDVSPGALASLAALNGLRCSGQWRNSTLGTSGALSVRLEAGGGGGLMSFEVGGPVFGAQGGVFEAPFRLDGAEMVIDARSEFLGRVSARVGLDGKSGQAALQGPPALGPAATVTMTGYSLVNNVLHFGLTTDYGDGRPPATSVVEAACAAAR